MLKALQVQNFTAFKNCNLTFSQGLNVLCGENAAGKSHLLKLGYALLSVVSDLTTKTSRAQAERAIAQKLAAAFNSGSPGRLVTRKQGVPSARVRHPGVNKARLPSLFPQGAPRRSASKNCTLKSTLLLPSSFPQRKSFPSSQNFLQLWNEENSLSMTHICILQNLYTFHH